MTVASVGEITAYLKELFQIDPVLGDIWVRGEASNISRPASGHYYLTLRDSEAALRSVCFKQQMRYMNYRPQDGDAVLAHGRIGIYEATGQYQLYIDMMQPDGVGIMAAQFERLRVLLEQEGLFEAARKRPLPLAPRCIGVVTSASGAVWHDIQTVVSRRYPLTTLVLAPAAVQGANAPAEIVAAMRALQEDGRAEVLIVGRGGGSAEDLAAFNDERVVRAIFASRLPVISAVGHETDVTLADLVADVRAATPSAAAELCTPDMAALFDDLRTVRRALAALVRDRLDRYGDDVLACKGALLRLSPARRTEQLRQRTDDRARAMTQTMHTLLTVQRERLKAREAALVALDPRAVLQRGYAMVTDTATGEPVRDGAGGYAGRRLTVRVAGGAFGATATGEQHQP